MKRSTNTRHDGSAVQVLCAAGDLAWMRDELLVEWRAAQHDAVEAYLAWRTVRGPIAYAAYRAAQDRADAAQDRLGEHEQ